LLKGDLTLNHIYDTLLKEENIKSLLEDVLISATDSKDISLDTVILSAKENLIKFDTYLRGEYTRTLSFSLDTFLERLVESQRDYIMDLILSQYRTRKSILDTLIRKQTERNLIIDVVTKLPYEQVQTFLDALLFRFTWINYARGTTSCCYNMSTSFMLSGSSLFTDVPVVYEAAD